MTEVQADKWAMLQDIPDACPEEQELEQRCIDIIRALHISSIEIRFDACGDSVHELEPTVHYDPKYKVVPHNLLTKVASLLGELLDHITDTLIWDKVTFYEISDGYYDGEYGVVTVDIEEDAEGPGEHGIYFTKQATSRYNETETINGEIVLDCAGDVGCLSPGTPEHREYNVRFMQFILDNVTSVDDISESAFQGRTTIRFAKDFVAVGEQADFLQYFTGVFSSFSQVEHLFSMDEPMFHDENDESREYEFDFSHSGHNFSIDDDGCLRIRGEMSYRYTDYRESED